MKASCLSILLFIVISSRSQTSSFPVYFDFDKYALTENTILKIDSFTQREKSQAENIKLELHGHCDSVGSEAYNLDLSNKRVMAVKQYLVSAGIAAENIILSAGHGKRNPLNENKTEEERQLNRRVEIIIIVKSVANTNEVSLKEKIADSSTVVGTNIVLQNINFIGGRHQFLSESFPRLNELLDAMRTYPALVIQVQGHICCQPHTGEGLDTETGVYNLSEARAKAVMDYLVSNGIAGERISYKGFGHSNPLFPYPENSEEERTANRRVEIKIINK